MLTPWWLRGHWLDARDDVGVTGYRTYRGGVLVTTLDTVTSFQDTGLSPSTTYSYTVDAVDAAGNVSAQSAQVTAVYASGDESDFAAEVIKDIS